MMKFPVRSFFITKLFLIGCLCLPAWAQSEEDCLTCHEVAIKEKINLSIHGPVALSCLDCHLDLREVKEFPHPEKLQRASCEPCHQAEARELAKSIHGMAASLGFSPILCQDCHGGHEVRSAVDQESAVFSLNLPTTCQKCHLGPVSTPRGQEFIRQYTQSVHFRALEKAGLTISANCTHCHGDHNIYSIKDQQSKTSRRNIISTCGQCHVGIKKDYLEGVHGIDYLKGIKDVPVCTDCHSEHYILSPQDKRSSVYATKVASLCSNCHDDQRVARQYGLLTARYITYAESYHGTASRYGDIRVANCASCHGYHNIRPSSDPLSPIHPANLPSTCGKCHPGASRLFAEVKIHLLPNEEQAPKYQLSYLVKKIYIIFIIAIVSLFLLFILADISHRLLRKQKHG